MFRAIALSCVIASSVCSLSSRAAESPVTQRTAQVVDSGSYVSRAAIAIWGQPSRDPRARVAIQMTQWMRRNPDQVTDADISILAGLMRHDDDIVRREAAASLGFVGHRAVSAAPALIQALRERPCSPQPAMPADTIRVALERIDAEPVNIPCADPFGSP